MGIVTPSLSLEWDISVKSVEIEGHSANKYKGIVRDDNGSVLSIVKKSYQPLTNENFKGIVEKLSEFAEFPIEGYSIFNGGGTVMASLYSPEKTKLCDEWDMDNYLIVGNSHDYSRPFFIGTSNMLIRCSNQFSKIAKRTSVAHTRSIDQNIDKLVGYYADYLSEQAKMIENFEHWNGIKMSPELIELFTDKVFDVDRSKELSTRKSSLVSAVNSAIKREINEMGSNLLGAFNGITYYTTHMKKVKEPALMNIVGPSANLNASAYQAAIEVAELV